MGRPINNIRKAILRIKTSTSAVQKLVQIGETVVLKMTGNANFATPSPTLVNLTAATTDVKLAMAKTNYKRSRGSKADQLDTVQKATTLKNLLLAELDYVANTAIIAEPQAGPAYNAIIASSGFALRSVRSITPKTQIATMVRQSNTKQYPLEVHRLDWRRPLGLIKGQPVAGYNISHAGVIVATTTKTNWVPPVGTAFPYDVMITPFNSKGSGNSFFATIK